MTRTPLTPNIPSPASVSAMIVATIETGNESPAITVLMQQWATALGGTADLTPMTPEGRLLYLLALTQASPYARR